jgi:hypothetical protein
MSLYFECSDKDWIVFRLVLVGLKRMKSRQVAYT